MTAPSAQTITKASKSNLALAFIALPKAKREAMTTFYAFCRVIDDIADEPGPSSTEKQAALDIWKEALEHPLEGEPALAAPVRELISTYGLKVNLLRELIRGCEMDLHPTGFQTFEELQLYCYRVASVVGLVSIEIFGYRNPATQHYAVELGYALQLTNIIRDVHKDLENEGRIYLPREDLDQFGITSEMLAREKGGPRFSEMMAFQAQRAESFYSKALSHLTPEDRRSLSAAEIMRRVYHRLLGEMKSDGYRVFERSYRLSRWQKMAIIARVLLLG